MQQLERERQMFFGPSLSGDLTGEEEEEEEEEEEHDYEQRENGLEGHSSSAVKGGSNANDSTATSADESHDGDHEADDEVTPQEGGGGKTEAWECIRCTFVNEHGCEEGDSPACLTCRFLRDEVDVWSW
jgi:hypothetical protein